MKNKLVSGVLLSLLILAACSKNTTSSNSGSGNYGSWTFKGTTYPAVTSVVQAGPNGVQLLAYSSTSPYAGDVQVVFDTLSPPAGTYFVSSDIPSYSNQVYITKKDSFSDVNVYASLFGNGAETVQVTIVGGKIHVAGSGIKLTNISNLSDSNSALSLNIAQQ